MPLKELNFINEAHFESRVQYLDPQYIVNVDIQWLQ